MSGSFIMSEDDYWSGSSGVFYWVVDFLADNVKDRDLVEKLRETSEHGFRWVNFNEFTKAQVDELLHVIRHSLLDAAEKQFPLPEGEPSRKFVRNLKEKADGWSTLNR